MGRLGLPHGCAWSGVLGTWGGCLREDKCHNNNNNNNQYIYKQRQSHAMSQRRWLATAVIFRPSDVSLGFGEYKNFVSTSQQCLRHNI